MKNIEQLAAHYLDLKNRRDKKESEVKYQIPKQIEELQKGAFTTDGRIRLAKFEEESKVHADVLNGLENELVEAESDLKPLLAKVNATRLDPLRINVDGDTYFDTFLEDGQIISAGHFTLLNR